MNLKALVLALILTSLAFADIMPLNKKYVEWCYRISNIDDYKDYVFFIHGEPSPAYEIIKGNECFSFYKLSVVHVYAVRKELFNKRDLETMQFLDKPHFIKSDMTLTAHPPVDAADPLKRVEFVLKIKKINRTIELEKIDEVKEYENMLCFPLAGILGALIMGRSR